MTEEKTEEKVDLVPEEPPLILLERDAKSLIKELFDITSVGTAAFRLPATSNINRTGNFYVEEVIRTMKEYNVIE